MRVYIKLQHREIKTVDVPADIYVRYQVPYSILEYRWGEHTEIFHIRQDSFFNNFKERYPEIVKSYKLTSSTKPSTILSVLKDSHQIKFLSEITGKGVTNWKWIRESELLMDSEQLKEILTKIITKKLLNPITQEKIRL
ncbi:MAG: hypothetical protein ACM3SR_10520 [Ignavibacteriales bacterium]